MSSRAKFVTGAAFIVAITVATNIASMILSTPTVPPYRASAPLWTPELYQVALAIFAWYLLCWINIVQQWNRRPVMFFGKYAYTAGPGLRFIEPLFFTTLHDVPVQDIVVSLKVPNLQTKDNVGVQVEALLTYRINEGKVKDAIVEVGNVSESTLLRAVSTISDVGGTTDLDHFLVNRAQFGAEVVTKLKERVAEWGVIIKALELRSFKINDEKIEQAIAMKARAQKEAGAELARAEMQVQITTALNEGADKLSANGWRLKEIETLLELCRSGTNNTLLIPTNLIGMLDGITGLTNRLSGGLKPEAAPASTSESQGRARAA